MKYDKVFSAPLSLCLVLSFVVKCHAIHGIISIADKELVCTIVPFWMEDLSPEETRAICDGSGTCLGTSQMEGQVAPHSQEEDCLTIYMYTPIKQKTGPDSIP